MDVKSCTKFQCNSCTHCWKKSRKLGGRKGVKPIVSSGYTSRGLKPKEKSDSWIKCEQKTNMGTLTTRGPWATLLTWVLLANISLKNKCKITFLSCDHNSPGTMTLKTYLCIRSPFNQICIFVGQEFLKKILSFPIETNVNMF